MKNDHRSYAIGKKKPEKISPNVAPNEWLHSSVGRASRRYHGGHGFESRRRPDFFRLLLSNCLNWKIHCDDHSSFSHIFLFFFCIFWALYRTALHQLVL